MCVYTSMGKWRVYRSFPCVFGAQSAFEMWNGFESNTSKIMHKVWSKRTMGCIVNRVGATRTGFALSSSNSDQIWTTRRFFVAQTLRCWLSLIRPTAKLFTSHNIKIYPPTLYTSLISSHIFILLITHTPFPKNTHTHNSTHRYPRQHDYTTPQYQQTL